MKKKRSKFEDRVARELTALGVTYAYEPHQYTYYKKPYKPVCLDCGSKNVASERIYTPDFWLPDYGFYIEAKGKFAPADRKKMQLVREAHPELDVRLVFMANNKTSKNGKKRYSDWAEESGFLYSVGEIDESWF